MFSTRSVRRTLVLGAALIAVIPAAVALAQPPGAIYRSVIGNYKGEHQGQTVVINVAGTMTDLVDLRPNRPTLEPALKVKVKRTGDILANVEGDGKVSFNLKANPIQVTYKPSADVTFVGDKF